MTFLGRGGTSLIHSAIQVFILNFVTALDNAIVLAGIFKSQPSSLYWFLAAVSTILLTLTRVILVLTIHPLSSLPGLQLLFGVMLLGIALHTANVTRDERGNRSLVGLKDERVNPSLLRLFGLILVTDLAVSFDNLVSIIAVTTNVTAVAMGVFLSIVPLMFLLPIITKVFSKMPWVQIIAAGVMTQTAVQVLAKDPLVRNNVSVTKYTVHTSLVVALVLTAMGLLIYIWRVKNCEG